MNKISPETMSRICSLLGSHDLCQFRLVCSQFSKIGAQYICPDMLVKMIHDDLGRLFKLSREPRLAWGLTSLHYAPAGILRPKNYKEIQRSCHRKVYLKKSAYRLKYLRGKALEMCQEEQHQIIQAQYDLMCFSNTFTRFPNLRQIVLYFGRERSVDCTKVPNPTPAGTRNLEVLLDAISQTKINIKSLILHNLDWRFFDGKNHLDLKTLFEPIANLESLDLTLRKHSGSRTSRLEEIHISYRIRMENGTLRKCLPTLTKLRRLKISFGSSSSRWDAENIPLNQIVPQNFTWTHLKTLRLARVTCERQELMEFLLRHKETLRELCLFNITLRHTSWLPLLADIREQLYLTTPCVCGFLSWCSEDGEEHSEFRREKPDKGDLHLSVNRYLERGGEAHPEMGCPLA